MLTTETAQEFAWATLQQLEDAALRHALAQNGRAYLERHHNWPAITDQLVEVYERAIDAYSRRTSKGHLHPGGV